VLRIVTRGPSLTQPYVIPNEYVAALQGLPCTEFGEKNCFSENAISKEQQRDRKLAKSLVKNLNEPLEKIAGAKETFRNVSNKCIRRWSLCVSPDNCNA
jgi:uncharacterized iron-regulated protein